MLCVFADTSSNVHAMHMNDSTGHRWFGGPSSLNLMRSSSSHQDSQAVLPISSKNKNQVGTITLSSSQTSDDDGSLFTASLDTSTLRRQLSNLEFDSSAEPKNVRRQAKSASDIVLSRSCPADTPPKPKVQKLRRRKQEFDQLLQTPPNYWTQNVAKRTRVDSRRSEADSGFGSSESGNSANESELRLLSEVARGHSKTPPLQVRVQSPVGEVVKLCDEGTEDDDDHDMNLMLFTPFKIGSGSNDLLVLSPDIELSAAMVAGSDTWVPFTPHSTIGEAITSTPCRLRSSTPKCSSSDSDCANGFTSSGLPGEFADNCFRPFDGITSRCHNATAGLTSASVLMIDEAIDFDVTDLSFSEVL